MSSVEHAHLVWSISLSPVEREDSLATAQCTPPTSLQACRWWTLTKKVLIKVSTSCNSRPRLIKCQAEFASQLLRVL